MANFCSDFLKILSFSFSILIVILTTSAQNAYGCYTSIFAFGDSLTDTGNYVNFYPQIFPGSQTLTRFGLSPYGETYFHHPTGRCSDGRLIIDFIAEYYGLPLVPPYFRDVKVNQSNSNFDAGVNFAVLGAPALPVAFHEERGIHYASSNVSMGTQLGWFKELLPYLCNSSKFFQRSLFLMGPFGGNDYGHAIFQGRSLDEVKSFVPLVMNAISSAIEELIQLGAKNIMVPGLFPDGCLPMSLTQFEGSNKEDYDPETGCLNWLNNISEHHNKRLQEVLNQIRQNHPDAVIIYADYFNAIMPFYHSPQQFGFEGRSLRACCGVGGHYNFNFTAQCGESPSTSCADPSSYISWDGTHFTEAAYRLVAQGLLEGPHTIPHIRSTCIISTIMDWPLGIS